MAPSSEKEQHQDKKKVETPSGQPASTRPPFVKKHSKGEAPKPPGVVSQPTSSEEAKREQARIYSDLSDQSDLHAGDNDADADYQVVVDSEYSDEIRTAESSLRGVDGVSRTVVGFTNNENTAANAATTGPFSFIAPS